MVFSNSLFSQPGDSGSWPQGMAQPVTKSDDLTPHVDGGPKSTHGTMSGNVSTTPVYDAAIIVGIALALLWIAGAFTFRNHNL